MAGLNLTGNPANITTPLTRTVTGLTNNGSGAIRVTTSAPHQFGPNDTVEMAAPPAVGIFTIAIISPTTFDLVGSTYTTTGTGVAIDQSLTPQIQVPIDGMTGSLQLSGMLSTIQGILDRTQYLVGQALGAEYQAFTTSGTFKVPPNCFFLIVRIIGGGGGGEGGKRGEIAGSGSGGVLPQGGGGSAAPLITTVIPVTPGDTLTVHLGNGGAGGTAGGGAGGDGTSSWVTDGSGNYLVFAEGAAGCGWGSENWGGATHQAVAQYLSSLTGYSDTIGAIAPGASDVASNVAKPAPYSTGPLLNNLSGFATATTWTARWERAKPRKGGAVGVFWGTASTPTYVAQFGCIPEVQTPTNPLAPNVGGSPGTPGTTSGTGATAFAGGCAGGGGGTSAFAAGGAGGNGGNGNSASPTNATAGGAALGYGAGGGGGGSGGDGSASGGTAAAGGAGGAGYCDFTYVRSAL